MTSARLDLLLRALNRDRLRLAAKRAKPVAADNGMVPWDHWASNRPRRAR